MTIYEQNIEILVSTFPSFNRGLLQKSVGDVSIEVSKARNGMPTASSAERYIHSRFDPWKEAVSFVDSLTETGCALFFGFGLGYFVEAYIRKFPNHTVIVVEPNPQVIHAALESRDLSAVCGSRNVSLLIDVQPDAVAAFLNSFPAVKLCPVAPRSVIQMNAEYYTALFQVVETYEARRDINANTLNRFGRRWIRNLIGNLHLLPTAHPLRSLEGTLSGVPAVILAAGPSLDELLPALPAIADRCVIIAVDTSFRAVIKSGVQPDFLVVVDPQYWNARHLDGCDTSNIALITESATYPTIFRHRFSNIYFGDSLFPLGAYLEKDLGPLGKLGAGGSVATSAWDVARLLGCSPIYSAGLDLGFPHLSTHFRGSRFEDMQLNNADRLGPVELGSYLMLNDAAPFFVESNSDRMVLTDKRLITYKWWFENQIKIFPEMVTYNLSPDGVKIEGMPYQPVKSLLEYPKRDRRANSDRPSGQPAGQDKGQRRRVLNHAIYSLQTELKRLGELSSEAIKLSDELQNCSPGRYQEIVSSLNRLDYELLTSSVKQVAGFLVQDTANEIVEKAQVSGDSDDALERSKQMYTELEEAAAYHIELLRRYKG